MIPPLITTQVREKDVTSFPQGKESWPFSTKSVIICMPVWSALSRSFWCGCQYCGWFIGPHVIGAGQSSKAAASGSPWLPRPAADISNSPSQPEKINYLLTAHLRCSRVRRVHKKNKAGAQGSGQDRRGGQRQSRAPPGWASDRQARTRMRMRMRIRMRMRTGPGLARLRRIPASGPLKWRRGAGLSGAGPGEACQRPGGPGSIAEREPLFCRGAPGEHKPKCKILL